METPGLYQNQAFVMWVYADGELAGQEVKFDVPITVTEDKEITVKAYYGEVIYVTFWQYAAGKVVLERKQLAKNADGKYIMNLNDVTVPAPKTTLKFMGWSKTAGTDASEDEGDEIGRRALLPNGNYEFTEDTDVYPVYYSGIWVVFVSAKTGMGADYRESYFLSAEERSKIASRYGDKIEYASVQTIAFDKDGKQLGSPVRRNLIRKNGASPKCSAVSRLEPERTILRTNSSASTLTSV